MKPRLFKWMHTWYCIAGATYTRNCYHLPGVGAIGWGRTPLMAYQSWKLDAEALS